MKVALLTSGGLSTPSTRLRWINYSNDFVEKNIQLEIINIIDGIAYRSFIKNKKLIDNDVLILQKVILNPLLIMYLKNHNHKIIFDIDDAIWLPYLKRNIKEVAKKQIFKMIICLTAYISDEVICGSHYILNFIKKFNKHATLIYSLPIDLYQLENDCSKVDLNEFYIIGWTGTKNNLHYFDMGVLDDLRKITREFDDIRICIISDGMLETPYDDLNQKIINIPWSINNEIKYIPKFNIGLMPQKYENFSLGKGAFKLIYYMKYSIVNISSDIGEQKKFIVNGVNGYLVENEWYNAIKYIYTNPGTSEKMRSNIKKTFFSMFSKEVNLKKYYNLFRR